MAITLRQDGITFSQGSTRSQRPLTIFATATLVSSINNVNSAQVDYVNIPVPGNNDMGLKGLPAVTWTFDYFTFYPGTPYPYTSYVYTIERHLSSTTGNYIRVGIYHGTSGGPHLYYVQCVGNFFSPG
jgi:hypothetical protein